MDNEMMPPPKGRDATVLFPARVLLICRHCGTDPPQRYPCGPGVTFSWDNNPHMQVAKPVNHDPFTLVDDQGGHHTLEYTRVDVQNDTCFLSWRTQYFACLMGNRERPERWIFGDSLVTSDTRIQFAWHDNLHLLRDDFHYVMESPDDPDWDIKTLALVDITGATRKLSFGNCAILGKRIEIWRATTIDNTIKGFQRVFGAPTRATSSLNPIFERVLGSYINDHGQEELPLEDHFKRIQTRLLPELGEFNVGLEISGPNFPDFFRNAIARSDDLQWLMRRLRWEGRVDRKFNRKTKATFRRELVVDYVRSCDGSKNMATHYYNLWKLYQNAVLDCSLPMFRRRLLVDPNIMERLEPFSRPKDMRYRYGDLAKANEK